MLKNIFIASIALFIAVDAIGTLPVFISLTAGLKENKRKEVLLHSLITAFLVAFIFILIGKSVFKFIGITIQDFMVAGGILLFGISFKELLKHDKYDKKNFDDVGVVPLGTPLIAGPAVLTASLLLLDQYGFIPITVALTLNIILAGIIFYFSGYFIKLFGETGTKAISKIMALLLASFAVMLIRKGILEIFKL